MKTTNNDKPMNCEYEQMDIDALKKRILAYSKMSDTLQKATAVMKQKGAKA